MNTLRKALPYLVLGAALCWAHGTLRAHEGMHALYGAWAMEGLPYGAMLFALVLMPLNWALEAAKWRALWPAELRMGLWTAWAMVWKGVSTGAFTPGRSGEFIGRVHGLPGDARAHGVYATLYAGWAQTWATLVGGVCALLISSLVLPIAKGPLLLAFVAIALLVAIGVLRWLPAHWVSLQQRWPLLRGYGPLQPIALRTAVEVFAWAGLRYAVFTLQYAVVLVACTGVAWAEACAMVPLIFLLSTLWPFSTWLELGVRGAVAVALMPGVAGGALLAAGIVWALNRALPTLIGALLFLRRPKSLVAR